jgi:beta-galactosidase/beta-glucuronidase
VTVDSDIGTVWYQRTFTVPDWGAEEIALNIGACDYDTWIYINGHQVGQHRGGYTPIHIAIGDYLQPGSNTITVRAADSDSWQQPRGKQAGTTRWPIDYDSVIGIWQSVWLEPVDPVHLLNIGSHYAIDAQELQLTCELSNTFAGQLAVTLKSHEIVLRTAQASGQGRSEIRLTLPIENPELWSPETPHLYSLELQLVDENNHLIDQVTSYTGLRELTVTNGQHCLNGKPLFLRGILDQGYFPEGWYSPESDQAIKQDIELTKAMGFNFVRKHQKAEDPRYLYWADKMGLLVWAEMPSGRIFSTELVTSLTAQWLDLVRRDRGHPCVIGWVPFNESWGVWHIQQRPEQRALVDGLVQMTKALDSSRPVIGNDGWEYSSGDLWTLHLYHDAQRTLDERLAVLLADPRQAVTEGDRPRVGALVNSDPSNLPVMLTECGGVGFETGSATKDAFAYGELPTDTTALEHEIRQIMASINASETLQGFVWTQLTDVQQEINGLLYFDRRPKLPLTTLQEIFGKRI